MSGIKIMLTAYILFGNTYLYTYYSIVTGSVQADEFRHSTMFLFVIGSYFATPVLFWVAGFLHAFSFLQQDEDKLFTASNLGKWYFKKIFRYIPLIIFTLIIAMYIIPLLGGGPVWSYYDLKVMKGCHDYWWTNILLVNNIVPASGSFDDKCMPWTWFIPCLIQVSLLLPGIMYAIVKLRNIKYNYCRFFYLGITLTSWICVFTTVYIYNSDSIKNNKPHFGAVPIVILPTSENPSEDPNKVFTIDFRFYN